MLVYSVFLHLFAFTIVLFMPQSDAPSKKISPVVLVELLEVSSPAPKAASVPPKPATQKPKSKPAPPASKKLIQELDRLKTTQPKPTAAKKTRFKADLKELDRLAKLSPKLSAPAKIRNNPLMDETLQKLEELKSQKPVEVAPLTPVREKLDLDKQFEELEALKTPTPLAVPPAPIPAAVQETLSQDAETPTPASASNKEQPVVQENLAASTTQDLVKALEQLANQNAVPEKADATRATELTLNKISGQGDLEPIIKKLEGLSSSPAPASIEVKSETVKSRKFSSTLRELEVVAIKDDRGHPQAVAKTASVPNGASTTFPKSAEGIPTNDALSLYIGTVKQKVMSNWKSPLGAEHDEVLISFYIYPKGNIDEPVVQKHSTQPPLDGLAVRAILEARPFDTFPEDLKEANLHVTIRFKYVSQN